MDDRAYPYQQEDRNKEAFFVVCLRHRAVEVEWQYHQHLTESVQHTNHKGEAQRAAHRLNGCIVVLL